MIDTFEIDVLPDGRLAVSAHFDDLDDLQAVADAMQAEDPSLIVSVTPDDA